VKLQVRHNGKTYFRKLPHFGPQTWPWWRLLSMSVVKPTFIEPPDFGVNIWFYTRWFAWQLQVLLYRKIN